MSIGEKVAVVKIQDYQKRSTRVHSMNLGTEVMITTHMTAQLMSLWQSVQESDPSNSRNTTWRTLRLFLAQAMLFLVQRIATAEVASVLQKFITVNRSLWAHITAAILILCKKKVVALWEVKEVQDRTDTKGQLLGLSRKDHPFIKGLTICLTLRHLSLVMVTVRSSTLEILLGDQEEKQSHSKKDSTLTRVCYSLMQSE